MPSIPFFVFLVPVLLLNLTCILERRALALEPEQLIEQRMGNATSKHFVLVHGSNHGAWCWYKLVTLLKDAGHHVTALDLAANGVNPRRLNEVVSFSEYMQPLTDFMASLPNVEKVVLVGHSFGGISISLAMENFPEKVSLAVFVAAFMPNYTHPPATLLGDYFSTISIDSFLDCQIQYDSDHKSISILFGPKYLVDKVYNGSPKEDQELAETLVRPTGLYLNDLSKPLLTKNKYGSVTRVFIISSDDQVLPLSFQKYMIENSPPKAMKSIYGCDHMVMVSQPKELFKELQEIADTYNEMSVIM